VHTHADQVIRFAVGDNLAVGFGIGILVVAGNAFAGMVAGMVAGLVAGLAVVDALDMGEGRSSLDLGGVNECFVPVLVLERMLVRLRSRLFRFQLGCPF
jgi:hypothetical protein